MTELDKLLANVQKAEVVRLQPKDILVLKMAEPASQASLSALRAAVSKVLGFPMLVITLSGEDDVSVLRYDDALKQATEGTPA